MKPAGGTYKPNRMNINKIPKSAAGRAGEAGAEPGGQGGSGPGEGAPGTGAGAHQGPTTAKVMSASPLQLITIMYEQFLELIPDIKLSITKKSAAAMEPDSERAQAIVEELLNALDFDVEISKDLGAIYYYVRNRILEANIRFDASIWDEIEATMRPLYEGFKEAERQIGPGAGMPVIESGSPSIVAGITYGQGSLKEIVVNTKSGLKA